MALPETLQINGLQLSNNDFTASPPGSLAKADNVIIDQKGVAQIRNGQRWLSPLPAVLDLPFALTEFQGIPLVQYGLSKTDTAQGLGYVSGGAVTPYSGAPFNPVGDNGAATDYMRMKFCLASLFLHFCCAAGPKVLEAYNGTPRESGMLKMPDMIAFTAQVAGQGVIPYNSSVAYQSVHKRTSSVTGVPAQSPPSNRFVVTNRWIIPIGGLVRAAGVVTVTLTPGAKVFQNARIPFQVGATFTLSPGEANFPAGLKTVTGVTNNTFTYAEGGAGVASTVVEECNPGSLVGAVTVVLPSDAIAGEAIQVYRSVATTDSTIDPPQDVYLVQELYLSAGDIVAGAVQFQDTTPEGVLQDALYTNPTDGDGLGPQGENRQPPVYGDVTNYDSRTWYANTIGQQYMELQMLGVGAPNGVQNNDTITINGTTFTFKTAPAFANDVQLVNDGTPAFNIAWTTWFLSVIANQALKAAHIAVYTNAAPNGFPGGIRIERTNFGGSFSVTASRPASWSPALDASAATNSTPDAEPNGLWESKLQEPEAVPPDNFRNVGSANYYIRRIFGLRNALIIIKEGDGIWSLTGSGGSYTLAQISTANTIAPDCACVFSDCVWAYTDQGILRISDSGGVVTVSRAIDTVLNDLASLYPTETYAWSFAVPYEVERRVMFYVPSSSGSGQGGSPTLKAFCYSLATNSWTGPLYVENSTAISGVVTSARMLHLGIFDTVSTAGKVTIERKGATVSPFSGLVDPPDYLRVADAQRDGSIIAINVGGDSTILRLSSITGVVEGCGITQGTVGGGNLVMSKIIALRPDIAVTAVQVADANAGFAVNTCLVFDPYTVEPQLLPQGGDPAARKSLSRIVTLFKEGAFANLLGKVTLETDVMQDELLIAATFEGFGLNPFGTTPYGDPTPLVVDSNPPDPKWANAGQFRVGLRLKEVWAEMKLQGMAPLLEGATGPVGRGGKPG